MDALKIEDLAEQVSKSLRDMILTGELVPGQKLVQTALSERLGVSRTPLLAAFSKLEKELLVELVPRRGAFVKQLSARELVQLYEIRLRLEPLGAAEAARVAGRKGMVDLDAALSAQAKALTGDDPVAIRLADYNFHMAIMKLSGNAILERILSSFSIISKSNQSGLMKSGNKSLEEHTAIRAAIIAHDDQGAEQLMAAHLQESRNVAVARLRQEEA
ncbi:MAG: GntR family transcriptional regulator [Spirochaetes bacterium]|nr:GntR family transcriptional regulator [Spirochaetota bacterium]MBU0954258.1 GntR family transcriptional regulator [Spirochaetota bacterium]